MNLLAEVIQTTVQIRLLRLIQVAAVGVSIIPINPADIAQLAQGVLTIAIIEAPI